MEPHDVTHFETPQGFREWLQRHHMLAPELWVGYWNKASGKPSVTWEETVDEALCVGWIDGIRKRVNDESYTIRFTPRRAKSVWSHRNMDRYAVLAGAGKIAPAGARAYSARTDARSGVYSFEQTRRPELSPEYLARLKGDAAAWHDWESRPPGYRRQVAQWVMSAKRESTRERRLLALIADSSAGRKVKPLR